MSHGSGLEGQAGSYITTVRARFDLPDGVTAPPHLRRPLSHRRHEDNDMMLSFIIEP
jgi:hypothetical protein